MSMWIPWIDYEGHDRPGSVVIVDTPWWWVVATEISSWLCNQRAIGHVGFRLLQWSARRSEAASLEVFRVPMTDETSESVRLAIEGNGAD